jgi:putative membrane protein
MTYMSVVTISDLPALNATLNAISAVFISLGWNRIRRGHWQQHVVCMIAAIITSTLFLTSYITYHVARGGQATKFSGLGLVRPIYFVILITHVLLAFTILPMVIVTLVPTFQKRWDKHRRVGKWTMPIWLYVSVTGVLVYLMLYKWWPPIIAS